MKARTGFVSNSSSSSFMILASEEAFNDTYRKLHPMEKKVIDDFTFEGKVGRLPVKGLSYGVDLNWDGTESIIEDITSEYKRKHPDDDYSKFKEDDECILNSFQGLLIESAEKLGESTIEQTEGRG